jgi:hypothetical protein
MTGAINIQYPGDPETWNTVVVDAADDEAPYVWYEGMYSFIVKYHSREQFDTALGRFSGTINYQEVTVH